MGERVVGLVETGRVPKLRRIEDDETGFTKFTETSARGLRVSTRRGSAFRVA